MNKYIVYYPQEVVFEDGTKARVSIEDNLSRNIVVNVTADEKFLRKIFRLAGFKEVLLEHKKQGQFGRGMRKRITKFCDVHIRFLRLKEGEISIDAEVEISRAYVQHLRSSVFTVVKEVEEILRSFNVNFRLFHKGFQKHIERVTKEKKLHFYTPDSLIEIKAGLAGILFAIILIIVR